MYRVHHMFSQLFIAFTTRKAAKTFDTPCSACSLRFLCPQLVMNCIRNYHVTSLFSGSVVMEKSKQEQLNQSGQLASQSQMISEVVKHRSSTSKSRSKSRSPGRSIEGSSASAGGPGSSGRSSRPCSLHASREHSPDNISGKYDYHVLVQFVL